MNSVHKFISENEGEICKQENTLEWLLSDDVRLSLHNVRWGFIMFLSILMVSEI